MKTSGSLLTYLVVAAVTVSCSTKDQASNFEGTITYRQDLAVGGAMAAMGATMETMLESLRKQGDWGDTIRITYSSLGHYRISVQNQKHSYKIYRADSNKIYSFIEGDSSKSCLVQEAVDMDFEGKPDNPTKPPFDTTVVIKGVSCKGVRFTWKMGRVDYFYDSTKLKIDPAPFGRHTTEGLADFLASIKSLPYGITRNIAGMQIQQILIDSKAETVSKDLFHLPTLVKDDQLNPMNMPGIEVMRVVR